jgi:hypothetical protein
MTAAVAVPAQAERVGGEAAFGEIRQEFRVPDPGAAESAMDEEDRGQGVGLVGVAGNQFEIWHVGVGGKLSGGKGREDGG